MHTRLPLLSVNMEYNRNTQGSPLAQTLNKDLPIGLDVVADIHKVYPYLGKIKTIFDVGANIGQTSRHFHQGFSNATIFSFEPIQQTFIQLQKNTADLTRIRYFNHAFGDKPETKTVYVQEESVMNSLVDELQDVSRPSERVQVKTIDEFGKEHQIDAIDLLKTDTEGWELNVIQGASRYLAQKKIKFIYSEVGWLETDKRHTFFSELYSYLIPKGFRMYALYDHCHHFYDDHSFGLVFANALFINSEAINEPINPEWWLS
jgi:FkbM family methyltransferase